MRVTDSHRGSTLATCPSGVYTVNITGAIPDREFYNCDSLTNVTIGNSVTSIGNSAFHNCFSLANVTIGNSVTSIGDYAFESCDSLTNVTIGDSVTSIGRRAFASCFSCVSFYVSSGNLNFTEIDGVLVSFNLSVLVVFPCGRSGSYTIPESVTSIGSSAFYNCDSLASVTIGNSVTSIGNSAFEDCDSLVCLPKKKLRTQTRPMGQLFYFGQLWKGDVIPLYSL